VKPLHIDFAPRSLQRTLHNTAPGWWAVMLAGLLAGLSAAVAIGHMAGHERAQQARERERQAASAAMPVASKVEISPAQATAVNAAVLQLNLPWRDLHEAVQEATPATVALLALEPDARTRKLRISGEAKNSDAMISYVEKLKEQPFFVSAVLARHEVNEQDPNLPLRFQVEVQWTAARGAP
jgi:Tfp pilus assembly protein PilN